MSLDPIKIPQNVYIEDRIVGPLTLRQIILVAVGTGFSYVLWATLSKSYGSLPLPVTALVWIPCLLSFAFAFVRINDISLMRIALLMIENIEKPPRRVYAPRQGLTINIRTFTGPVDEKAQKQELQKAIDQKAATPLEQITKQLDSSMPEAAPTDAETQWRRPVNPQRIQAEPLITNAAVDGIAGTTVPSAPRSSLFRDLSPAPRG